MNIAIRIRIPPEPYRERFDVAGKIQWQPVNSSKWYWMDMSLSEPQEMKEELQDRLFAMSEERDIILILGDWDRGKKMMHIERFLDV